MLDFIKGNIKNFTQKKRYVKELVRKTGCSKKDAGRQLDEAVKNLGITYRDYVRAKYYLMSPEEQIKKSKTVLRQRKNKEDNAVKGVMKATGWDLEYTEKMIKEAQKRTGCTHKEYYIYRFYELSREEQEKVFVAEYSKKLIEKYDIESTLMGTLTDKGRTNNYFSEYLGRPWCVNNNVSFEEFKEIFSDIERIIYKPVDGNRGKGIKAFYISDDSIKDVYEELTGYPEGVVEAFVIQHPELSRLSPDSINTIRIVSLSSNKKSVADNGDNLDIAYAALRIGRNNSVVDNFHSGGMVAAIDMETGKLVTDAADMKGNVFAKHPDTGTQIKGFEIPYFNEAIDMVKEAIRKNKIEGYLGWDVAISETGPVLIEVNARPGVVLLTMPYVAEKKGMKYIMEKYM